MNKPFYPWSMYETCITQTVINSKLFHWIFSLNFWIAIDHSLYRLKHAINSSIYTIGQDMMIFKLFQKQFENNLILKTVNFFIILNSAKLWIKKLNLNFRWKPENFLQKPEILKKFVGSQIFRKKLSGISGFRRKITGIQFSGK